MHRLRPGKPSPSMVVAVAALVVALGGTASAAFGPFKGDTLIKQHSLSGNRLKNNTITGAQINLGQLGTVPNATVADTATTATRAGHATAADTAITATNATNAGHATTADTATNATNAGHATTADTATDATNAGHATTADTATDATNAGHATNSDELGGSPRSSFQSRVTGTCGGNSGITAINADGSVGCGNVRFFGGRLVERLNGGDTFLTIPGIAHLISLNCQAGNANAALINDALGTTDIWTGGDTIGSTTNYVGTNWTESNTTFAPTGAAVWHLGQGSGSGAKVITITVSTQASGSNCIFQGTAEVITTS